MPTTLTDADEGFLREAIAASFTSRERGDHPFGATFVDAAGNVLAEGLNSVVTTGDVTGHAEANLVREIGLRLAPEVIAAGTVYTSCEPCAMCAGALYWAGVNRIVYAMSQADLMQIVNMADPDNQTMLEIGCRAILATGHRPIEVLGPFLSHEATPAHHSFWNA